MPGTWKAYERDPGGFADLYESLSFESIHGSILGLISAAPLRVLDIGAGSGRDAAWFAGQGYEVVACEPSDAMRREGRLRHPEVGITWVGDALPELARLVGYEGGFGLVMLSGVWMHLEAGDRPRAFGRLVEMLAPGGRLIISLRHGPDLRGQGFFPVSEEELEGLAAQHGLQCIHKERAEDTLKRDGVSWSVLGFER